MTEADYQAVTTHLRTLAATQQTQTTSSPEITAAHNFLRQLKAQHFPATSTKFRLAQALALSTLVGLIAKNMLHDIQHPDELANAYGTHSERNFVKFLYFTTLPHMLFTCAYFIFFFPRFAKIHGAELINALNFNKDPNAVSMIPLEKLNDKNVEPEYLWRMYKLTNLQYQTFCLQLHF